MHAWIVKVWLCTSGADRYLKSHPGLYQQILNGPRSEHLVDLITTGDTVVYVHLVELVSTGETVVYKHLVELVSTGDTVVYLTELVSTYEELEELISTGDTVIFEHLVILVSTGDSVVYEHLVKLVSTVLSAHLVEHIGWYILDKSTPLSNIFSYN